MSIAYLLLNIFMNKNLVATVLLSAPSKSRNVSDELSSNLEKNDPDFGNCSVPAVSLYSLSCH